jgi:hypothetical protein
MEDIGRSGVTVVLAETDSDRTIARVVGYIACEQNPDSIFHKSVLILLA